MSDIDVVVATCGRLDDLHACLTSLLDQSHRPARVVVVDDRPGSAATPAVVASFGDPAIEYVEGPSRGLAAAHNRGLEHARSARVAFTDDDVVADAQWLETLVAAFDRDPQVACVTGRIVPFELETPAQVLLECYAGFDKGRQPRVFDADSTPAEDPLFPFAAGTFGSGANMAFTREWLDHTGGFDAALGTGTRACGGDDLCAFFEVLRGGRRLAYEPGAIIRHRHAREIDALERQVFGYGVGLTAYLTRCVAEHPELTMRALRQVPAGLAHVLRRDATRSARLLASYPARLRRLERIGMLVGPFAYLASRRESRSGRHGSVMARPIMPARPFSTRT